MGAGWWQEAWVGLGRDIHTTGGSSSVKTVFCHDVELRRRKEAFFPPKPGVGGRVRILRGMLRAGSEVSKVNPSVPCSWRRESNGSGPWMVNLIAGKTNGERWLVPKGVVSGVGAGPGQPRAGLYEGLSHKGPTKYPKPARMFVSGLLWAERFWFHCAWKVLNLFLFLFRSPLSH